MKDEAIRILEAEGVAAALDYLDSDGFPSPAERVQGYHELMKHAYWKLKNLPATIKIGQAGIAIGEALAGTHPEQHNEIMSNIKAIHYDLASFTWPGWDEPDFTITAAQTQLGLKAAKRNLQLAIDLRKPPLPLSRAYWMLAAQEIAARQYAEAKEHFFQAEQTARETDSAADQLLSRGFVQVTGLLADPDDLALTEKLNEVKAALQVEEHGEFFIQQMDDALRVFGE
jgi:hypothetical protein